MKKKILPQDFPLFLISVFLDALWMGHTSAVLGNEQSRGKDGGLDYESCTYHSAQSNMWGRAFLMPF